MCIKLYYCSFLFNCDSTSSLVCFRTKYLIHSYVCRFSFVKNLHRKKSNSFNFSRLRQGTFNFREKEKLSRFLKIHIFLLKIVSLSSIHPKMCMWIVLLNVITVPVVYTHVIVILTSQYFTIIFSLLYTETRPDLTYTTSDTI